MKNFTFMAILQQDLTGEQIERLFKVFEGDAASGVRAGVPHVHFDLDASSLDEAIHKALAWISEESVLLEHIELSGDSLWGPRPVGEAGSLDLLYTSVYNKVRIVY